MSYNIPLDSSGDVDFTGTMTASFFVGDGSQLTNLPSAINGIDETGDYTWTGDHTFDGVVTFTDVFDAVDGSFAGTVTSNFFSGDGTGSVFIEQPSTGSPIWVKHGTAVSYAFYNTTLRPAGDGVIELGLGNNRWEKTWSVNGSFSGNLVSEAGGSYKLYNLGTEGDTDTEALVVSADGTTYDIFSTITGTGAHRRIDIGGFIGTAFRGIRLDTTNGVIDWQYNNATKFRVDATTCKISSTTTVINDLKPSTTGTHYNGTTSLRWSNVASVDGDFSGELTVDTIKSSSTAYTNPPQIKFIGSRGYFYAKDLDWAFRYNHTDVDFLSNILPLNDNDIVCGQEGSRWSSLSSYDGSFSGNLVSEAGGSIRHYGLGTEGDTDSHYLQMQYDGTYYRTGTQSTGSGGNKALMFDYAGQNRLLLASGEIRVYKYLRPSDTTIDIGSVSNPFRTVYSVDGDFSGDVTLAGDIIATGGTATDSDSASLIHAFAYNGSEKMRFTFISLEPKVINMNLGSITSGKRWGKFYSVDGSFSGNLVSETGGSYKLYNLGTEGDTDTEYLETVVDTDIYCIRTGATGSGSFLKKVYVGTGFGGTNSDRGLTISNSEVNFNFGGTRFNIAGGQITTYSKLIPISDGLLACGEDGNRWSNVASVDGDFSGTISTDEVKATLDTGGSLTLRGSTDTYLDVADGTMNFYCNTGQAFRLTSSYVECYKDMRPISSQSCGVTANRWTGVYSVDGSFSGSLVSEAGGSYKLYNLGSEGDTDTEYLQIGYKFGKPTIESLATGTGVERDIIIGDGTGARLDVRASVGQTFLYGGSGTSIIGVTSAGVSLTGSQLYPASNDVTDLGTSSLRWSNVASVDGDFSGDVVMAANVDFTGLPTTDPGVAGRMWNDSGSPKISSGGGGGAPPP